VRAHDVVHHTAVDRHVPWGAERGALHPLVDCGGKLRATDQGGRRLCRVPPHSVRTALRS
jgi:hypothetical protein